MASTSIQFIGQPSYSVDFRQYAKPQPIEVVAVTVQDVVLILFSCIAEAGSTTISNLNNSFRHIVLGYGRDSWFSKRIHIVVFKIAVWFVAVGWCFITTTARLFYQHFQKDDFLSIIAGDEIDLSHIVTHDLAIDMSEVPQQVAARDLLQMYDKINFDNPEQPGYMTPLSRQEESTTYSKEELRESLQTFVDNVNGRVAFIGTPPAYDTPRLFAFYQQLEDAVRFTIHKSNQDLAAFIEENGADPTLYQGNILQQYSNILEDRARIALMLSIAGKHCGARYMGEAMELYDAATANASIIRGTLQDTLIEILAAKRKEIANAHIQRHFGSDSESTMAYTNYMSSLGKTLALPGMANVIEHLSQDLDRIHFLKLFFDDYTVDCILATVQAKVKSSQAFREQIIDWLKTQAQAGNWQPADMESLDDLMAPASPILEDNALQVTFVPYAALQELQQWIAHLKQQSTPLPDANTLSWDDFLNELFAIDGQLWQTKYPQVIPRAQAKQRIKDLFSDRQLGKDLIAEVKRALVSDEPPAIEPFLPRLLALQKVERLRPLTQLDPDTAMRVAQGTKPLKEALAENQLQIAGDAFVAHEDLHLEDLAQNGLSKEMLEWILVSQGILRTQVGE